jgi:hypothetical protein
MASPEPGTSLEPGEPIRNDRVDPANEARPTVRAMGELRFSSSHLVKGTTLWNRESRPTPCKRSSRECS